MVFTEQMANICIYSYASITNNIFIDSSSPYSSSLPLSFFSAYFLPFPKSSLPPCALSQLYITDFT